MYSTICSPTDVQTRTSYKIMLKHEGVSLDLCQFHHRYFWLPLKKKNGWCVGLFCIWGIHEVSHEWVFLM